MPFIKGQSRNSAGRKPGIKSSESEQALKMNPKILTDLVKVEMPFGKYKGAKICDLPEYYLAWFKQQGFPKGSIGILLETMLEIKMNGLEYLLTPLKKF